MKSKTDRIICGTCEFWTGKRLPVFDLKGKPKIDIIDEYGVCEHPYVQKGQSRRKDLKCIRYSKWTEIL